MQLNFNDVSIGYDNKPILNNLNFNIEQGDYLCIIGENGSGKSTLMKTLLGLIPTVKGKVTFGDNLSHKDVGYLPQQTLVQKDFPASVFEVVLSGCQSKKPLYRPFYNKKEKELAKSSMQKMHISDFSNRCYRELSGGQQQRVLLARALCATNKILLLDEPVTGLDPKTQNEMYNLIKELNDDGITIIMISHDVAPTLKYASKILHLGPNVFFGTKEDFLETKAGKAFANMEVE